MSKVTPDDVHAIQGRINQILIDPTERSPGVRSRILADADSPARIRDNDKPAAKMRSAFDGTNAAYEQKQREDQKLAASINHLNDPETGRPDAAKMAAAGLSERAQQELVAAHDTKATVESMGKMSGKAIEENHTRILADIARDNPDVMQYARGPQTTAPAASTPSAPTVAALDMTP